MPVTFLVAPFKEMWYNKRMNNINSADRHIHLNESISVYLTGNVVEVDKGQKIVSVLVFETWLAAILEYEKTKYELWKLVGGG